MFTRESLSKIENQLWDSVQILLQDLEPNYASLHFFLAMLGLTHVNKPLTPNREELDFINDARKNGYSILENEENFRAKLNKICSGNLNFYGSINSEYLNKFYLGDEFGELRSLIISFHLFKQVLNQKPSSRFL